MSLKTIARCIIPVSIVLIILLIMDVFMDIDVYNNLIGIKGWMIMIFAWLTFNSLIEIYAKLKEAKK